MKLYSSQNPYYWKLRAGMLLLLLFLCTPAANADSRDSGDIGKAEPVLLTQSEIDYSEMLTVETNSLFSYTIPESEYVRLSVFDTKGRELVVLIDQIKPAGEFSAELKKARLAKGVYYLRLVVGKYKEVRKLIITK